MSDSRFDDLVGVFEALGAEDPAGWAMSELTDDSPQLARFLVLRSLWRDAIDSWATGAGLEQLPVARRLVEAGADRADLVRFARAAAYEAVFTTLDQIDEGYDPYAGTDASLPGWRLMETDSDRKLTGREVGGLHEEILMMDPSGREGSDLWL